MPEVVTALELLPVPLPPPALHRRKANIRALRLDSWMPEGAAEDSQPGVEAGRNLKALTLNLGGTGLSDFSQPH
ncbi:hypothetical protein PRBEI_2001686700 [Prionailurus iriomotensis]